MTAKHLISGVAIALLSVACGYGIKTSSDYDRNIGFANDSSFFLVKGNSSGDPLMDQRLEADVKRALTSKGWIEVPEGDGHSAVVIHTATKTKHSDETFYGGWGGWGWQRGRGGAGGAATFVNDYKIGTVVVDVFDAKTKEAIWHGSTKEALSDSGRASAQKTEHAIDKMFRKFQPTPAQVVAQ